jgi:hypothetical protein
LRLGQETGHDGCCMSRGGAVDLSKVVACCDD